MFLRISGDDWSRRYRYIKFYSGSEFVIFHRFVDKDASLDACFVDELPSSVPGPYIVVGLPTRPLPPYFAERPTQLELDRTETQLFTIYAASGPIWTRGRWNTRLS